MAKSAVERMEVGLRRSERLRQTAPQSKRRKSGQTKEKSETERLTLLELDFEKELTYQKDESEESRSKPRREKARSAIRGGRRAKTRPSRRFTFKELELELASEAEPNFFSCEVGPSMWPKRLRCHCLKWARYKCPRCLGPFCSLECQKAHSEVLCR